ncbi:hypothetical protein D3C76_1177010 [compost metagenome]
MSPALPAVAVIAQPDDMELAAADQAMTAHLAAKPPKPPIPELEALDPPLISLQAFVRAAADHRLRSIVDSIRLGLFALRGHAVDRRNRVQRASSRVGSSRCAAKKVRCAEDRYR